MARTKGTYSLPANIEVLAGAPLDARDRVATKADLTTSGTFPYPYVGMETFVVSEGKKYVLTADDPTQAANWSEVGSGGGAVEGYYNTTDGLFYKENTYTTAIPGAASTLYIDLATNKIYRYNGSAFILTPALGLTIAADSGTSALDLASGTKYKITVGPDTFIFKTPSDEKVTGQVQNPTSGTTYNVPFIGTTNQKPYYNNGFQYTTLEGTANAGGYSQLVLGNSTSTGTAGNKRGSLVLYSEKNGNVTLRATGTSANGRDIYFPDKAGTVALTSDITSDTIPSAYCATPAGTAAKLASCSSFALNSNSYIHVLIANSNTSASALTLNINNTGAKTIYINGSASSSSNYTLPAGTYIVFYNGTNYYFRTDGVLPGSATDNTKVAKAGDTMTGALKIDPNIVQLMFRDQSEYYTTASYQTAGNEALVFATRAAVTSFMFVNNEDSVANHGSSRWQSLTPGLQIKNNCVSIGALIPNGTSPANKLYVNGNSVSSGYVGVGGNAANTSGARMVFDSTTNSINFTFVS